MSPDARPRRAALVTLGCARNEVDSEELAGRLTEAGWDVVTGTDDGRDGSGHGSGGGTGGSADGSAAPGPDVVLVNTCGFVAAAKKDSVDTMLAAADTGARVVGVGCLAQRYGDELAEALPEAAAVLSFDDYADIDERLTDVLAGRARPTHTPVDRRTLLPLTPVARPEATGAVAVPGHGWGPWSATDHPLRRRLDDSPVAPLKIASGCDRRCTFCAIPSFRGSFVSRPVDEVVAEAAWLTDQGAREVVLVSENSTSYGKDLGQPAALEQLLLRLGALPGLDRVRVSYLQPAEMRPSLVRAIAQTPGVAPYYDLSFQHASAPVLRRMRRFGSTAAFLELLAEIRHRAPGAGVRSNVIVGFPGETEQDLVELERFLTAARLDAVGVFGYSDEEGTEAAGHPAKHDVDTVAQRVARLNDLVEQLTAQRAEERLGEPVEVLVESVADGVAVGRAAHQAPEVDGEATLSGGAGLRVGDLVAAVVTEAVGVDLVAEPREVMERM